MLGVYLSNYTDNFFFKFCRTVQTALIEYMLDAILQPLWKTDVCFRSQNPQSATGNSNYVLLSWEDISFLFVFNCILMDSIII